MDASTKRALRLAKAEDRARALEARADKKAEKGFQAEADKLRQEARLVRRRARNAQ